MTMLSQRAYCICPHRLKRRSVCRPQLLCTACSLRQPRPCRISSALSSKTPLDTNRHPSLNNHIPCLCLYISPPSAVQHHFVYHTMLFFLSLLAFASLLVLCKSPSLKVHLKRTSIADVYLPFFFAPLLCLRIAYNIVSSLYCITVTTPLGTGNLAY